MNLKQRRYRQLKQSPSLPQRISITHARDSVI